MRRIDKLMVRRPVKAARGFTLVEALVSILVLAVGILGVAAVQAVGLRNAGSADHRAQAAWLAYQMLDEVRAQPTAAANQDPTVVSPGLAGGTCGGSASAPVESWRQRIACALPAGRGGVQTNSLSRRVVITVSWDDARGSNATMGSTVMTYSIESIF